MYMLERKWNNCQNGGRFIKQCIKVHFLWSANYKVYWCTLQQGRVLVSFGIFCCFFLYEVHFGTFEQISSKFWPGEAWNRRSRCLHRVIESFHFLLNSITVHHLCSQSSSFFYDVYTGTLIIKVSHSDGKNQVLTLEQGCLPEMPGSTIPKFGPSTLKINIYFKANWPGHPSFSLLFIPGATDLLPSHPIMTFYVVLTGGWGEKRATIRWNKIQTLTDL